MRAGLIVEEIKKQGITHVVGLPDNGSRALFEELWSDSDIEVIGVTREGEAFAIASGLYLGGCKPLVIIQNTGLFETGDAYRGTAHNMGIPLVMIVGYRGLRTMRPGAAREDSAATFLEPTLKAWDIPYSTMLEDGDVEPQVTAAFEKAAATSMPAAVLLGVDTV